MQISDCRVVVSPSPHDVQVDTNNSNNSIKHNTMTQDYTIDIDYDTMVSYYNQTCLRCWREGKYMYNDSFMSSLAHELIENQRPIIDICRQYQCSSYKLCKYVLERLADYPMILNQSIMSDNTKISYGVTDFLDNTNIITNERLRNEIIHGIYSDLLCSPLQDQIKECVGKEYEGRKRLLQGPSTKHNFLKISLTCYD